MLSKQKYKHLEGRSKYLNQNNLDPSTHISEKRPATHISPTNICPQNASNLQQLQRAVPVRLGRLQLGHAALAVRVEVRVRGRRTLELGGELRA